MGSSDKTTTQVYEPGIEVLAAGRLSVYELFSQVARQYPQRPSISDKHRQFTYGESLVRVNSLVRHLLDRGIRRNDRIAVLSENCIEYIELHLAAACIGAIVACQNWRLNIQELKHCVSLVSPSLLIFSSRFTDSAEQLTSELPVPTSCLQDNLEDMFSGASAKELQPISEPETGLLILYTSGTTGPAKAALISQRALVARMTLLRTDLDIDADDGFVAWSPMFHMGGSEHSLSTLMMGGRVFVADGFDVDYIASVIGQEKLGWLLLVPATIDRLLEAMDHAGTIPVGIKRVGAMADLLPKAAIARITKRLNAPFLNTFGATETGIAPASRGTIAPGVEPENLSKELNSLCALKLLDEDGNPVAVGGVGEAAVKGPTLFSGYWMNDEANGSDFIDGWFRMGDLFVQNPDGTIDFYGRSKYLIKSGGENIYPAEIESIILADERVSDAIVVASPDEKWGEVPVAVVATHCCDEDTVRSDLVESFESALAKYKQPKEILFVDFDALPRSSSGKIVRSEVEKWLAETDLGKN